MGMDVVSLVLESTVAIAGIRGNDEAGVADVSNRLFGVLGESGKFVEGVDLPWLFVSWLV